jgi:hypothetical protein
MYHRTPSVFKSGSGGKINRRTGMAKKICRGKNMRCTTECFQFLNPGSGGKISSRTGEAKKFAGVII